MKDRSKLKYSRIPGKNDTKIRFRFRLCLEIPQKIRIFRKKSELEVFLLYYWEHWMKNGKEMRKKQELRLYGEQDWNHWNLFLSISISLRSDRSVSLI